MTGLQKLSTLYGSNQSILLTSGEAGYFGEGSVSTECNASGAFQVRITMMSGPPPTARRGIKSAQMLGFRPDRAIC